MDNQVPKRRRRREEEERGGGGGGEEEEEREGGEGGGKRRREREGGKERRGGGGGGEEKEERERGERGGKRRREREGGEDKRKKQGRGTEGATYGQVPHYHGERVVVNGTELSSARVTWPTKRVLRGRGRTFISSGATVHSPHTHAYGLGGGGEGYEVDLLTWATLSLVPRFTQLLITCSMVKWVYLYQGSLKHRGAFISRVHLYQGSHRRGVPGIQYAVACDHLCVVCGRTPQVAM